MVDTNEYPYYLEHSCGKPAVFIDHMPVIGEVVNCETICGLDGKEIMLHEECKCGSCGESLNVFTDLMIENIKHV